MALTKMARLQALEALESEQIPTAVEYHICVAVEASDPRRGTQKVEGGTVTFYAATADEYEQASARYAQNRNIILIQVIHVAK